MSANHNDLQGTILGKNHRMDAQKTKDKQPVFHRFYF
jgi:hypothetical protein